MKKLLKGFLRRDYLHETQLHSIVRYEQANNKYKCSLLRYNPLKRHFRAVSSVKPTYKVDLVSYNHVIENLRRQLI